MHVNLLTTTAAGLAVAMSGMDAVVHTASSSYGDPPVVVDRLDGQAIVDAVEAARAAGSVRLGHLPLQSPCDALLRLD